MPGDVVHMDFARRREVDAERERIRALARGKQETTPDVPDAFPEPLEKVMATQDPEAKHRAAAEHIRILCRNIRQVEGYNGLGNLDRYNGSTIP